MKKQEYRQMAARLSTDLLDELRDCVVALSGPPHRLTVSGFVGEAIRRELIRRKRIHGKKFPKRRKPVRVGRPIED